MKYIIFIFLIFSNLILAKNIELSEARLKMVPPVSPATAMFVTIKNNSEKDYDLIKITSSISDSIEIHEMKMENNQMQMRALDKLTIKAHSTTELKPKSFHVMIFKLKKPLSLEDKYSFKLEFKSNNPKTKNEIIEVNAGVTSNP